MSGLLEGARRIFGRSSDVDARVAGLADAVTAARGRLADEQLDRAQEVVDRAQARLRLSADHTVVALAGATGSGKSSTFNALAELDLAAVGVRRPTTSWATACVWGATGASDLLEWLGIPIRHQSMRDSMLDLSQRGAREKDLAGLVLLDLPDHDSTEVSHHLEVDRLVELADLMVWVLDPQKYADAAIHDRFLRPLSAHRDLMLVVMNHIDEVEPDRRESLMADVRRLLAADGLGEVPVLAISAVTGEGIDDLHRQLAERVRGKAATRTRIGTDVATATDDLAAASGSAAVPEFGRAERDRLVDAVADAAGVPVVVDAVRTAATRRARRATGWPVTSWLSGLRPDPLKRLHLDLAPDQRDLVRAARTSLPAPDGVHLARVDGRVRELADSVSGGLTRPWASAVRRASISNVDALNDRIDRAISATDLGASRVPLWCRVVRVLQWLLLLAAVAGAVWLGALAVSSYLKLDLPDPRNLGGLPVPTVMLVGGVVLGVLLALVCRVLVRMGARSRAARAERRLRGAIAEVTEELVVEPIAAELAAYKRVRDGLAAARG
jgi:GTP-binding protein EngB required for normal cell division